MINKIRDTNKVDLVTNKPREVLGTSRHLQELVTHKDRELLVTNRAHPQLVTNRHLVQGTSNLLVLVINKGKTIVVTNRDKELVDIIAIMGTSQDKLLVTNKARTTVINQIKVAISKIRAQQETNNLVTNLHPLGTRLGQETLHTSLLQEALGISLHQGALGTSREEVMMPTGKDPQIKPQAILHIQKEGTRVGQATTKTTIEGVMDPGMTMISQVQAGTVKIHNGVGTTKVLTGTTKNGTERTKDLGVVTVKVRGGTHQTQDSLLVLLITREMNPHPTKCMMKDHKKINLL